MSIFDHFRHGSGSQDGAPAHALGGSAVPESTLEEPGGGGTSLFIGELTALRRAALLEATRLGQSELEPEQWDNGRMLFEYERHLAHEHEGLRDRLAEYVAAEVRDVAEELHDIAGDVASASDTLHRADRELASVLHSWNHAYREVHEDELELGRYFRLKSKRYQAFKIIIAIALFLAEFAVSTALFDRVVSQDNAAMPVIFSLGLILVLIVVPHYSAIAIKDGIFSYHEAEMRAYEDNGFMPPVSVRKKARREEIDDRGIKWAAGFVGLALVALVIPLSSLRATELGSRERPGFWFAFFLLLQFAISGYFFVREWMDHGAASVNLKHHDAAKDDAEGARQKAFGDYTDATTEFEQEAQRLLFLYSSAAHWDSQIVEAYYGTIHEFRHSLALQRPDLDVFITHATVPLLTTFIPSQSPIEPDCRTLPMSLERPDLAGDGPRSRDVWLAEVSAAATAPPTEWFAGDPTNRDRSRVVLPGATTPPFEHPTALLERILRDRYGLEHPYCRPPVLDQVQELATGPKDVQRLQESGKPIDSGVPTSVEMADHGVGSLHSIRTEPVRFKLD